MTLSTTSPCQVKIKTGSPVSTSPILCPQCDTMSMSSSSFHNSLMKSLVLSISSDYFSNYISTIFIVKYCYASIALCYIITKKISAIKKDKRSIEFKIPWTQSVVYSLLKYSPVLYFTCCVRQSLSFFEISFSGGIELVIFRWAIRSLTYSAIFFIGLGI